MSPRARDAAWVRAIWAGFLTPLTASDEELAEWTARHEEPGRRLGAWDGERWVGTFVGSEMELTVPGGTTLPAAGVTAVTTLSTHRRRGVLTAMMERGLRDARERGDAVAVLIAAEHRIYGRFGFGHATRRDEWTIDLVRSGGLRPGVGELAPGARIDLVRHLEIPSIAPDHPLPLWLANPRAVQPSGDRSHDLWLRLLDAPRAFAARRYDAAGRTVLDVRAPQGYVAGRRLLETFADGTGALTATTDEPDLALDADALAAVYLGGVTVPQLAAAGLVRELTPGAAARAGLQLRTALAPWCPNSF